jgi:tRNA A37 methylthiotransferase MiaB
MTKLDETEADIARMTSEIEKVQEVIDNADEGKKEEHAKAKKEEKKKEKDDDDQEMTTKKTVNVKVTNFSPAKISGLEVTSLSTIIIF